MNPYKKELPNFFYHLGFCHIHIKINKPDAWHLSTFYMPIVIFNQFITDGWWCSQGNLSNSLWRNQGLKRESTLIFTYLQECIAGSDLYITNVIINRKHHEVSVFTGVILGMQLFSLCSFSAHYLLLISVLDIHIVRFNTSMDVLARQCTNSSWITEITFKVRKNSTLIQFIRKRSHLLVVWLDIGEGDFKSTLKQVPCTFTAELMPSLCGVYE